MDWDEREDHTSVTPPYLDENTDDAREQPWKDLEGEEGDRQPVTPELIVEFDEEAAHTKGTLRAVVDELRNQWPSSSAFATVFQNMSMEDLRRDVVGSVKNTVTRVASGVIYKATVHTISCEPNLGFL